MNGNENNMAGNERAWMERNIEGHDFLSGVAVLVKKLSFFLKGRRAAEGYPWRILEVGLASLWRSTA